ncbi:MAG TPA: peptidoglycan DD-metalloendopeptidase family protein [Rhizomicrobium sp.]|nr:peptidoglycan DD-metalloendopeptidase family protein [Rhizomicrobium sp.]
MADGLVDRVWAWLHATFPERQIYIRSDGRVQFFTFGATLQATMAGLALIFLGWVAFASVNVIFKDRIIAAKDHRYQTMQSTYENRVADLQLSYDELNNALVGAEDRFKNVADELQAKQTTVAKLLQRKEQVDSTFQSLQSKPVGPSANTADSDDDLAVRPNGGGASDSIDSNDVGDGDSGGGSQLNVMPQTPRPQPRTAKPVKASFLDETVGRLAGAFFRASRPSLPQPSAAVLKNPAFRALAEQTERIRHMSGNETALLVGVDKQVSSRIAMLETVIRRVGINPDEFENQKDIGGPDMPLGEMHIDGISDQKFIAAYASAGAHGEELDELFAGLRHVPLTTPVRGAQFEVTSGFGGRVDPFTHHISFHPGIDFAGPWGSPIAATAPGTVVYAGPRGGYGNMVEIDHGYGIHTRYGHMSAILVHVGQKVAKGTIVGKLGSTGRSTGPHVHYEVWLADVVRNPRQFIEAGRHVFQ